MKKLLFIALCFAALNSKAQVIDTLFKSITSCKISPFKATFVDTVNVTYLGLRIISDNLNNSCTVYWMLMDNSGVSHLSGNAIITGADYANWNGNNLYPFQFVGKLYNLTFLTQ